MVRFCLILGAFLPVDTANIIVFVMSCQVLFHCAFIVMMSIVKCMQASLNYCLFGNIQEIMSLSKGRALC
jgi:hypothetical protein